MATRMFLHHPDRMGETLPSNGFSRTAAAIQAMGGARIAGTASRPVGAIRSPYGQFGETAPAGGTVAAPSAAAPASAPTDWKGIFEGGSKLVESLWGTYDKYQASTKKSGGATPISSGPPPTPPAPAGGGSNGMMMAAAAVALALALGR